MLRHASTRVTRHRAGGRADGAALDKDADPIKAAALTLKVIETADRDSATLTVTTTDDIENISLSELLAFAEAYGIDYTRPLKPLRTSSQQALAAAPS